jgi:hypothetical protein
MMAMRRGSLVGIATGYGLDGRVRFRQGQEIFLYSTASLSALELTQPLSPEVKRPRLEDDHSPPSNAEEKKWLKYTSNTFHDIKCCVKKYQKNIVLINT